MSFNQIIFSSKKVFHECHLIEFDENHDGSRIDECLKKEEI